MIYKDYKGFTKTYVIVHVTGNGVMEDRFVEHDVVYETNDLQDAIEKSKTLTNTNNHPLDIKSTWYENHYHINVNTLSDEGKRQKQTFDIDFDERIKEGLKKGTFDVVEKNGITFYLDRIKNYL